jgi:hypothetical protein
MLKKSNSSDSTLRKNTLPKAEKVKEVNADANKGLCKRLAGSNDGGNPKHRTEVAPHDGGPTVPGTGQEN